MFETNIFRNDPILKFDFDLNVDEEKIFLVEDIVRKYGMDNIKTSKDTGSGIYA